MSPNQPKLPKWSKNYFLFFLTFKMSKTMPDHPRTPKTNTQGSNFGPRGLHVCSIISVTFFSKLMFHNLKLLLGFSTDIDGICGILFRKPFRKAAPFQFIFYFCPYLVILATFGYMRVRNRFCVKNNK